MRIIFTIAVFLLAVPQQTDAAIYLEDGQLEGVRKSIERGAAQLRPCGQISHYKIEAPGLVETGLIVCG